MLEGLAEHAKEELNRCRAGDGAVLYRAQGASTALDWWIESSKNAPQVLEKLKRGT